ncbi:hypothetical protein SASPL_148510 [Salvia splendens]|uniref:Uncharacterized protein n=1 Tax=Salvia splendens TaxID=180675 RepID=A0A8X8W981_SALSN|nr:hypothetical protein SASPL_148510 [Salvia splendens]
MGIFIKSEQPWRHHQLANSIPSQSNIKVIINGAAKEIGRAAVIAVTNARGMEIVGAVDSHLVGQDIGKLKANTVVVDFTDACSVYDNVKQVYTVKHDITNVHSLMPGLLLAIRKVVRLKVILTSSQIRNASND